MPLPPPPSHLTMLGTTLAWLGLAWYGAVVSVMVYGTIGAWRRLRKGGRRRDKLAPDTHIVPGVSVIRPLQGMDVELYTCLKSSFLQTYPCEIIFCVQSLKDPASNVVKQLIEEFPDADARLVVSGEKIGPNPKINNIAEAYRTAKYDLIWVLDSNVWVAPNTLENACAEFSADQQLGVAHNTPLGISLEEAYGSQLDETYLLTAHCKFYNALNDLGLAPCVNGKSNFFRRSLLDAATKSEAGNGVRVFADSLAEDQLIAEALWAHGHKTALLDLPVIQPLRKNHVCDFVSRRVRWLRVRKNMVIAATLVEPFTEALALGLVLVFSLGQLLPVTGKLVFLLHVTAWGVNDYHLFNRIIKFQGVAGSPRTRPPFAVPHFSPNPSNMGTRRTRFHWAFVWWFRELLAPYIWIKAMLGSTVMWRGTTYVIHRDLKAEKLF